jgi:branched-chain amino acid transport system substrate-binding protein
VLDTTGTENPSLTAVVNAYRNAYPRGPAITPYTFIAYDCALILIQAIGDAVQENDGRLPTRQQVVAAVAHREFQGLTQSYTFDTEGDANSPLMTLSRVSGGSWVTAGQIDDSPTPA